MVANGIGRSIVAFTTANIAALAPSTSVSVAAQVRKYAFRCSSDRQACRSSQRECRHAPTLAPGSVSRHSGISSLNHEGNSRERSVLNLARPLEIARRRDDEGVIGGERALQNVDGVREWLPCARRVVAGESRRSECREALRRQVVPLAQELAAHRERFSEPRFSLGKVAAAGAPVVPARAASRRPPRATCRTPLAADPVPRAAAARLHRTVRARPGPPSCLRMSAPVGCVAPTRRCQRSSASRKIPSGSSGIAAFAMGASQISQRAEGVQMIRPLRSGPRLEDGLESRFRRVVTT